MKFYLYLLPLSLLMFSCQADPEETNALEDGSYDANKESMKDAEQTDPMSFLTVDATCDKNMMGNWVLEGTISSSASVVTYHDFEFKLDFYDKDQTAVGSESLFLEESLLPGSTLDFKLKTSPSSLDGKAKSVEFQLVDAGTK
jgi:hypothetical protein